MFGGTADGEVFELEVAVDSVFDLDGVDNEADVDGGLGAVERFAVEGGHYFYGVCCAVLFAEPVRV